MENNNSHECFSKCKELHMNESNPSTPHNSSPLNEQAAENREFPNVTHSLNGESLSVASNPQKEPTARREGRDASSQTDLSVEIIGSQDYHRKQIAEFDALTSKGNRTNQAQSLVKPCGLTNIGNTCYMNAALQCLGSVTDVKEHFMNELEQSAPTIVSELSSLFCVMWSGTPQTAPKPENIKREIGRHNERFSQSTQEDSQEFLITLLQMLHDDMKRVPTEAEVNWSAYLGKHGISVVSDVFEGQLQSSMKCGECKQLISKFDPFMFLSLPIPNGNKPCRLDDCLASFFKTEYFNGKCWCCSKCGQKADMKRKIRISRLPKTLMIYLKRFHHDMYGRRSKVNTAVKFPLQDLDISSYTSVDNHNGKYNLFAVICHHGSIDGGHYTAFGSRDNQWYHFNDGQVQQYSDTDIEHQQAYVLFYQKEKEGSKTSHQAENHKSLCELTIEIKVLQMKFQQESDLHRKLYENLVLLPEHTVSTLAEAKAITAEHKAINAEKRAKSSEEKAKSAEERAKHAEERVANAEKRATAAEAAISAAKKCQKAAEEKLQFCVQSASIAENKATVNEQKAIAAEKRVSVAEAASVASEKRAISVQKIAEKKAATIEQRALVAEQRVCTAEKKAIANEQRATAAEKIARAHEQRAIAAEKIASVLEEKAIANEQRAIVSEQRAKVAEEESAVNEQRAITAEEKATVYEQRAIIAERECAILKEQLLHYSEKVTTAERNAAAFKTEANDIKSVCANLNRELFQKSKIIKRSEENAKIADDRAIVAEERSYINEKRAKIAEDRAAVAATTAEKKASRIEKLSQQIFDLKQQIDTNSRDFDAIKRKGEEEKQLYETTLQVQTSKMLELTQMHSDLQAMNNDLILQCIHLKEQIASAIKRAEAAEMDVIALKNDKENIQNQVAQLMDRANYAEQDNCNLTLRAQKQIYVLASQCEKLQESLDVNSKPLWILKKEDILITNKELGRGAWGFVNVARLEVAAKSLHPNIVSPYHQTLFEREMNIAAKIRHPNLLLFIGATMDQGDKGHVILTELMFTSLRAILEKSQLSLKQIFAIGTDVARALSYLHAMKPDDIIHRDVSSANVLLDPRGDTWIAKLSDYGSCNILRLVKTQGPGNPSYAAPESHYPSLQSGKMDVFSFDILLFEMVSGTFPDMQQRDDLFQKIHCPAIKSLIKDCID